MKGTLSKLLIFAVGAAIGSAVTWKLVKTKYERIAQEEIDSVKEVFSRRSKDIEEPEEKVETKEEKAPANDFREIEVGDYKETLTQSNYVQYSEIKEEAFNMYKPQVIEPTEFGECDGYDTISLNYYADGVLTDDFDNPIEDVERMVGVESLTHFGEYEDDSVFVRNDVLKADFEILLDTRNYADVIADRAAKQAEGK